MEETDKKLVEEAKMIKEYCRSRDGKCTGCIFEINWSTCELTGDINCLTPEEWDLEADND